MQNSFEVKALFDTITVLQAKDSDLKRDNANINGDSPNGRNDELLNYIDILVDGPFIQEKRSLALEFRGSTNQRLIDVPAFKLAGMALLRKT